MSLNKLTFPRSLFVHYLWDGISSLRVRYSNAIDEYYKEINKIHQEISQTTGQSDHEATARTNESFYTNLHYATKLEMEKQGVTGIAHKYTVIQKIQKMLLEQLE